ncbi:phage replication protein [Pseudomonas syringae]|uniref:phage replication protein n=1 Tax=Pseudomonas syringae TaxID=317 RepID=UPI001F0E6CEB|nr:phage replication protein [Pseudomonas syringae]MCH5556846.1 phage replication protein [Pseudomonas syringae pv. syringae]MCH5577143.1 phage replication protein [Pseudomonas syringae pv. syringae]MCH5669210.1 phage replication protein [Pseudomonas syringae pv. syringae]
MGIILTIEKTKPVKGYTIIHNHILNDKNLSFKAKGILSLLLSLPPNPKHLSIELIARKNRDGISSIRSGIEELKSAGYLAVHQINNARGQYDGVEWSLRDTALGVEDLEKKREIPDVENPNSDRPPSGKRGLINTYKTKTLKNKKTTTASGSEGEKSLEDLRFTATMLAETQIQVRKALEQVAPYDRQRMLDDFCAAVRAGDIKKSELGWLYGVIKRYRNGEYNFKALPPKPAPELTRTSPPNTNLPRQPLGPSSVTLAERSTVGLESLSKLKKNRCRPS